MCKITHSIYLTFFLTGCHSVISCHCFISFLLFFLYCFQSQKVIWKSYLNDLLPYLNLLSSGQVSIAWHCWYARVWESWLLWWLKPCVHGFDLTCCHHELSSAWNSGSSNGRWHKKESRGRVLVPELCSLSKQSFFFPFPSLPSCPYIGTTSCEMPRT